MTLEGRSGPSLERVKRGIHVAIMGARTLRTRPLPYRQHAQSARTRSGPANRACHGGEFGIHFDVARTACGRFIRQTSCATGASPSMKIGFCVRRKEMASQSVIQAFVSSDCLKVGVMCDDTDPARQTDPHRYKVSPLVVPGEQPGKDA